MILFKPAMVALISEGTKTQTRRFWKRPRVKVGAIHNVNTSYSSFTGLRIRILRVWEQRVDFMSLEEVEAEGFEDWLSFMAYLDQCIGKPRSIGADGRRCYAVEFEVVRSKEGANE